MQRQSFLIGLGLTAFTTVATLGVSISPSFSQSNSSVTTSAQVTFFCREVFDSATVYQF
ncbi:MAG: hypothetical protein KME57_03800 [Scytonema hyalinum WJT4-NPBG1]|jgi:hypothetical protein|nr:hypothetical protein [Scytonema hyalinum WJT4-NPBG1]